MKKIILFFIAILTFGSISLASATNGDHCPDDAVYCLYAFGFDGSQYGRNLKVTVDYKDLQTGTSVSKSATFCFASKSALTLLKGDAHKQGTPTLVTVEICKDRFGQDCTQLSKDGFTLTKVNNEHTASPSTFDIDISKYLSDNQSSKDYPACLPTKNEITSVGNFQFQAPQN